MTFHLITRRLSVRIGPPLLMETLAKLARVFLFALRPIGKIRLTERSFSLREDVRHNW